MKVKEAAAITGSMTRTSKMPGLSYSLPAWECKTGGKLAKVPGSVCFGCYAMKGNYTRFPAIKRTQYKRLAALKDPRWVEAMATMLNSQAVSKHKVFRWHDAGDVQDLDHLNKIYEVCRLTPGTKHWMPTREAWVKDHLDRAPSNLVIRFSPPMVDMKAPDSWPNSSSVISKDQKWFGATSVLCPAPKQGGKCGDCRQCWNPEIKNVSYWKH